ncbi:MAG: cupin domain-containing protein [Gemmatimonadales bacterium]
MFGVINLRDKLGKFHDHWSPKVIADLNDSHVKLAKIQGEFVWHQHEREDELFLILDGQLVIEFRDRTLTLGPGEMVVIPRGVEHRPVAREEVHIMLIEPMTIHHTGGVDDPRTVTEWERI